MSYDPRAAAQAHADRELADLPLGAELTDTEPPSQSVPTSQAAAASMRESAKAQRVRVYRFMLEQGDYGATQEEASVALAISRQSMCARFWELEDEGVRLIKKTDRERPTSSGRAATVYIATRRP